MLQLQDGRTISLSLFLKSSEKMFAKPIGYICLMGKLLFRIVMKSSCGAHNFIQ